jgi:nucleoside-diphosphate-sugar epimerase
MRVFLTGGTGFIGRRLTRQLVQRGWSVTAVVRRPESADARELAALGVALARGDVMDADSMSQPMSGADVVIHNAGIYEFGLGASATRAMWEVNVDGTSKVLGLASDLGIGRVVHVSSIVATGPTPPGQVMDERYERVVPPASPYEASKARADEIAREYQLHGAPVIIVCPAGVIGPGDHSGLGHMVRWYLRGFLPPLLFASKGTRAEVHVDDCAEGIALAAELGVVGERYILSGGVMSHGDMIALWRRAPGGFPYLGELPRPLAWLTCVMAEQVQRLLGLPPVLNREFLRAGYSHYGYSGAKAERELGARFRSVEQAVMDTLWAEHASLKGRDDA